LKRIVPFVSDGTGKARVRDHSTPRSSSRAASAVATASGSAEATRPLTDAGTAARILHEPLGWPLSTTPLSSTAASMVPSTSVLLVSTPIPSAEWTTMSLPGGSASMILPTAVSASITTSRSKA